MRPDEHTTSTENKPRKRRMNLEFYYWERVGNRYYLRYTRFAYIGAIVFGLLVVAMLVGVIILDSRKSSKRDTKITVPSPSPSASYPVIRHPVSSPPARVNKPPQFTTPTPPATPTRNRNANDLLMPQQTPSAQPSTPPP